MSIPKELWEEIGRMIDVLLNQESDQEEILWLVEESTGFAITLRDYLNSEKRSRTAKFLMQNDDEKVATVKEELWRPVIGQMYYTIELYATVSTDSLIWSAGVRDLERLNLGIVFKTLADATDKQRQLTKWLKEEV